MLSCHISVQSQPALPASGLLSQAEGLKHLTHLHWISSLPRGCPGLALPWLLVGVARCPARHTALLTALLPDPCFTATDRFCAGSQPPRAALFHA